MKQKPTETHAVIWNLMKRKIMDKRWFVKCIAYFMISISDIESSEWGLSSNCSDQQAEYVIIVLNA